MWCQTLLHRELLSLSRSLVGISSPQRVRLVQRDWSLPWLPDSWLDRLPKRKKSVTCYFTASSARYLCNFFLSPVPLLSFVIFITSSYLMEMWYDSLLVLIYIFITINMINIFYHFCFLSVYTRWTFIHWSYPYRLEK